MTVYYCVGDKENSIVLTLDVWYCRFSGSVSFEMDKSIQITRENVPEIARGFIDQKADEDFFWDLFNLTERDEMAEAGDDFKKCLGRYEYHDVIYDSELDCRMWYPEIYSGNLELTDEQSARNDRIYDAVFELCMVLAENDDLEWDMEYIGEIADAASGILTRHGIRVRFPRSSQTTTERRELSSTSMSNNAEKAEQGLMPTN